ncbi:MAG: redoxin family protein, partial [Gammaproteobacteria bacterium]
MRYLLPFLIFTALILLFVVGLSRDPTEVPSPLIGKPAPRFVLPRLDNPDEFVDQETFAGQVTLVNVWATWCVGCRQEHDMLLRIAASGVVPIVGLNW